MHLFMNLFTCDAHPHCLPGRADIPRPVSCVGAVTRERGTGNDEGTLVGADLESTRDYINGDLSCQPYFAGLYSCLLHTL